ncbi:MAG TPA: cell division protein FtsH, partial [Solirubrobacterales bacterium]
GPATLELIDREVERIVGDAVDRAEDVLRRNWSSVYETANALVEQETLSGVALDAVLSTVQPTLLDLGAPGVPLPHPRDRQPQPEGE